MFAEVKAAGVPPNAVTFNTLIKACDNAGDLGQALGVFAEVKAAGVPPDEFTFNSLISACATAGDLRKGNRFFQEMCNAEIQPTDVTYSVLMELCDYCGRCDLVDQAFARAVDQGWLKAAVTSQTHNTGTARNAIDLHGCPKLAALAAVRHKLDSLTDRDLAVGLGTIAGQGDHSAADPVVPAAVMGLLKSDPHAGLAAAVDPASHGCIVIGAARLATWHAARRSAKP